MGPGAAAGSDAGAQREIVTTSDTADAKLPAITGQVVGPDERPIANAEVLCTPGVVFSTFGGGLDNLDLIDADAMAMDPAAMADRMRGQAHKRVAVQTDKEGRFRVRAVGDQRAVSLRILAHGHLVLERSMQRPTEGDADLGQVMLQRGAVIGGRVLDHQGNALEGVRVARLLEIEETMAGFAAMAMPGQEEMENLRAGDIATTDAKGRFELAHVPAGDFTLRARPCRLS